MGYLASDSYFSLKSVCWRLLIYLIILIVLVNEMKKIATNESVYVQNIYRFFSFRNTTITMSMKWKINDIRISSWVILIIFAWYARKYVLYLYFIYIAIILYLMWEYNCKISAFHVPRAHIPIIWLWMRTIRWIRGIGIQMLCNNDNNAKYFTTFEDTFYPPH